MYVCMYIHVCALSFFRPRSKITAWASTHGHAYNSGKRFYRTGRRYKKNKTRSHKEIGLLYAIYSLKGKSIIARPGFEPGAVRGLNSLRLPNFANGPIKKLAVLIGLEPINSASKADVLPKLHHRTVGSGERI